MNNSFSQMAFNFGAEEQVPLPSAPAPMKAEPGGYVVGQENGYSGVRVRIKSLKNVPKDVPKEEGTPEVLQEKQLNDPAPAIVKQETAKVIELKLFDLPPVEIIKEEIAIPDEPVHSLSAEEETGLVEDTAPEVDNLPITVEVAVEDNSPVAVADKVPVLVEDRVPAMEVSVPDIGAAASSSTPGKPAKSKRGRKSLKQATAEADLIEVPGDDILFSKQYYTMRAVAEMFRVNQSLLRFWETEFDILQPRKNKKGDRYFRPIDIKNLHLIYHLLRQRKYTIEGAKEFLKTSKKADERFEAIQRLQEIKAFLLEWKAQL
jgi:DNA-binding transcriptional MerR regulator